MSDQGFYQRSINTDGVAAEGISATGDIGSSTTVVAADTTGLYWLNRIRKAKGLTSIAGWTGVVPYLAAAQQAGAGNADMRYIKRSFTSL